MALEDLTGNKYISNLTATNPVSGDSRTEGDDHIRGTKNVLKKTFPNLAGEVAADQNEMNILEGANVTTAELNILEGLNTSTAELNALTGVTTSTAQYNYLNTLSSNVQTQLDGKATLASSNTFSNYQIVERDNDTANKVMFLMQQTTGTATLWHFTAIAGNNGTYPDGFSLRNASSFDKLLVAQDAGQIVATSGDLTFDGTSIVNQSILTGSAALNFGTVSSATNETLTMTVTGAAVGSPVVASMRAAAPNFGIFVNAWVSATDTVSIQVGAQSDSPNWGNNTWDVKVFNW